MSIIFLIIIIILLGLFLSSKNERTIYNIVNKIFEIKNEYKFYTPEFKFIKFIITFLIYFIFAAFYIFLNHSEFPGQVFVLGIMAINFFYMSRNIVSAKKQFTNFGAFGIKDVRQTVSTVSKDKIINDLYFFLPFFASIVFFQKTKIEEKIIYFTDYLVLNKGYELKPKQSGKYKYQIEILLNHFIDEKYDIDKEIKLRIKESHRLKIRIIDLMFRIMIFDENYPDEAEIFIKNVAGKLRMSDTIYEKIKSKFIEEKNDFEDFFNFSNDFDNESSTNYLKIAYEILGLTENSTNEDVKRSYRQLVQKHHPDKYEYLGKEALQKAQELFIKIQHAYETIERERNM